MARRSDVVLEEILDAIALIEHELAGHTRASFAASLFLQRATERSLEIISEAVRHLPDALLAMRPDIAWNDVRAIGNRIRHEYWRVDPALVWSIAADDLPTLRAAVEDLFRRASS
ncbi:HepT-like ribonuclease domain-containing protein [Bosea sp. CS1GBMeth4]|uniref:HepT-like ribonuclease domain-containing protein n=1 Tax=Bosea sp. CS1GBMeth4 TaxID=1892849 RepID=UPI00164748D8|nr:HepT-like ribonuclease domain-containing protein [Bosea sp. CS1GBMeth4]